MATRPRRSVALARPVQRRSHAERSHATQQDLIAATIRLIAERGLDNASTFEIAKAAGVTQGALQHHFANKKALILRATTQLVHSDDHNGQIAFWPDPQLPLRQRAEEAITTAWTLTYGRPDYVTMWSIFMACRTDADLLHHMAIEREAVRVRLARGFLQAIPELAGHTNIESPKIFKGENYRQLPYIVLDYPRHFSTDRVFAFRSMFWWGKEFSFTLHLQGKAWEYYRNRVAERMGMLTGNDFYCCVNNSPWQYYFENDNYVVLDELLKSP